MDDDKVYEGEEYDDEWDIPEIPTGVSIRDGHAL